MHERKTDPKTKKTLKVKIASYSRTRKDIDYYYIHMHLLIIKSFYERVARRDKVYVYIKQ